MLFRTAGYRKALKNLCGGLSLAAVLLASDPQPIRAQELPVNAAADTPANRVAWLLRRGYVASLSAEGARVTAIAGDKLRLIPAPESRQEICGWILFVRRAETEEIREVRIVDAAGNVLAECAR